MLSPALACTWRWMLGLGCAALVALELGSVPAAGANPAEPPKPYAPPTLADYDVQKLTLGGDFALTNHHGKRARLQDYRGRVVVMFFGYTYCPDVCPVTMSKVGRVRKDLGKRAPKLQVLFVSIDPARDTPQRLKAYVENFDSDAVALTGTEAEVKAVTGLFRVRYEKEASESPANYLVSHTAYLYMLDTHGKLRYVFPPDVDDGLLVEAARLLLNG